ncbi:MAG TPA: c-type cytochrome [Geobacteraceae bacterium]
MSEQQQHDFDGIRYRIERKSPTVFRVLFSVLVLWAVFFIAYYLFSGWSSEGEFARKQQAKSAMLAKQPPGGDVPAADAHREGKKEDYIAMGKQLFAERCISCHGADAKGGIGPDLTRKEFKYGKTEQAIAETIAGGRPGGMPSFQNDLSREKIEGLVKYILSL